MSLPAVRAYWDAAAPTFDEEADHGLGLPAVRAAWAHRLGSWLPTQPAMLLDVGCGTGSLTRLAVDGGHQVVGVDASPRMCGLARRKCPEAGFVVGDGAAPPVGRRRFDVVLARHLLWALPDPVGALREWAGLLRPGGRLVLIEGRWAPAAGGQAAGGQVAGGESTGCGGSGHAAGDERAPWAAGVGSDDLRAALAPLVVGVEVHQLAGESALWGRSVADERFAVVAITA